MKCEFLTFWTQPHTSTRKEDGRHEKLHKVIRGPFCALTFCSPGPADARCAFVATMGGISLVQGRR